VSEPLLRVEGLVKTYPVKGGAFQKVLGTVRAVDGVDLEIRQGEALGLVGESGCGKSTFGRAILRLEEPDSGSVVFDGVDILQLSPKELKGYRRDAQVVFQDPFGSLDPRTSVGDSIAEGVRVQGLSRKDRGRRVAEVLELVGLEPYHANRYPHEFSGGQRQRIGIARALAVNPRFLVLDEPVSALDVSIQSQILNLLKQLQRELDLTLLFIAHDLSVVEHLCDRIAVMYLGRIVEIASRDDLFSSPTHPYTEALLSAIPIPDPTVHRERILLEGDLPSPLNPPTGCTFHTRCPIAEQGICDVSAPELRSVNSGRHEASCHLRTGDHQDLNRPLIGSS
jgi:oligopeptide/dipeptide ABC transporter ATP-binding protein